MAPRSLILLSLVTLLVSSGHGSGAIPLHFSFIASLGHLGFNASAVIPAVSLALEHINARHDLLAGYELGYISVKDADVSLAGVYIRMHTLLWPGVYTQAKYYTYMQAKKVHTVVLFTAVLKSECMEYNACTWHDCMMSMQSFGESNWWILQKCSSIIIHVVINSSHILNRLVHVQEEILRKVYIYTIIIYSCRNGVI